MTEERSPEEVRLDAIEEVADFLERYAMSYIARMIRLHVGGYRDPAEVGRPGSSRR